MRRTEPQSPCLARLSLRLEPCKIVIRQCWRARRNLTAVGGQRSSRQTKDTGQCLLHSQCRSNLALAGLGHQQLGSPSHDDWSMLPEFGGRTCRMGLKYVGSRLSLQQLSALPQAIEPPPPSRRFRLKFLELMNSDEHCRFRTCLAPYTVPTFNLPYFRTRGRHRTAPHRCQSRHVEEILCSRC